MIGSSHDTPFLLFIISMSAVVLCAAAVLIALLVRTLRDLTAERPHRRAGTGPLRRQERSDLADPDE